MDTVGLPEELRRQIRERGFDPDSLKTSGSGDVAVPTGRNLTAEFREWWGGQKELEFMDPEANKILDDFQERSVLTMHIRMEIDPYAEPGKVAYRAYTPDGVGIVTGFLVPTSSLRPINLSTGCEYLWSRFRRRRSVLPRRWKCGLKAKENGDVE